MEATSTPRMNTATLLCEYMVALLSCLLRNSWPKLTAVVSNRQAAVSYNHIELVRFLLQHGATATLGMSVDT